MHEGKAMIEKTEDSRGQRKKRFRIAVWVGAAVILLLPYLAMQVSDQVVWDSVDFAIFGALLVGVGVTYEIVVRMTSKSLYPSAYRSAVAVALAAAFILVWLSLGVGIIGSDGDPANLMYFGVLAVGVIGAVFVRLQPSGMVRAMFATAVAQILAAVIALSAGFGSTSPNWPLDILLLTGFFTALWLISAWLFRKAVRPLPTTDPTV